MREDEQAFQWSSFPDRDGYECPLNVYLILDPVDATRQASGAFSDCSPPSGSSAVFAAWPEAETRSADSYLRCVQDGVWEMPVAAISFVVKCSGILGRASPRSWVAQILSRAVGFGAPAAVERRGVLKDADQIYQRYQDLQAYVAWTDDDAVRVRGLAPLLVFHLPALVEDFYAEIARHPGAHKVFTGGETQVARLKGSLLRWLSDLITGPYDRDYVLRRWKVGARHVEIGLDQVFTNVALSRLRDGLIRLVGESFPGDRADLVAAIRSLNKLLDLDLAKIEDAYQSEYSGRLQRSERLATLGQIAAGVAHELRNPLNVVQTSLYYLNNARPPSPEKWAEHMRRIERGVARANDVITTLSNFARMPVPEPRPFAVEPCVREALDDSTLPAAVEVTLDFPADLPAAMADAGQVRIVLGNLIRNASDAMPSGGRLTLTGRREADEVTVAVADIGTGIGSDELPRIMEPLYSTKARGLGLGLALSRMILERNKGTIHVASEVGKGSTFTIHLVAASTDQDADR